MVDLIDVEDAAAIGAKVKECIEKDPGAIEEEAMVIVNRRGRRGRRRRRSTSSSS